MNAFYEACFNFALASKMKIFGKGTRMFWMDITTWEFTACMRERRAVGCAYGHLQDAIASSAGYLIKCQRLYKISASTLVRHFITATPAAPPAMLACEWVCAVQVNIFHLTK